MNRPPYTLSQLVDYLSAEISISYEGDPACIIQGLNTLQNAGDKDLSFLANASYQKYLAMTQAACVILHPDEQDRFTGNKLLTDKPYYAYALLTELFVAHHRTEDSIHSSVIIGQGSDIAQGVSIAANVVIGENVTIESGVIVGANCSIGDNCLIKQSTFIYSNVVIYHGVTIGANNIIHSQAVIGSDGFGFSPKPDAKGWQKIHQLGGVVIGDDAEIGAGTTIDRGALGDTLIGHGVKLDNQIQIAHNVSIGDYTAIAAATAIAGSTSIGKHCAIAGAVGIAGHLTITDNVYITAMTLVSKSITAAGSYSSGTPMNKTSIWRKNAARFNRLDSIVKQFNSLEK